MYASLYILRVQICMLCIGIISIYLTLNRPLTSSEVVLIDYLSPLQVSAYRMKGVAHFVPCGNDMFPPKAPFAVHFPLQGPIEDISSFKSSPKNT